MFWNLLLKFIEMLQKINIYCMGIIIKLYNSLDETMMVFTVDFDRHTSLPWPYGFLPWLFGSS